MAVKLRLRRMGKKKQPIYKLVAADARAPRDGKFLEAIGLYNPLTNPATIDIKEDRALYWLGVGAQPTNTVKNLLSKKGILLRKELLKSGISEAEADAKMEEWFKLNDAKVGPFRKQNSGAKTKIVPVAAQQVKEKPAAEAKADKTEESNTTEEPNTDVNAAETKSTVSE